MFPPSSLSIAEEVLNAVPGLAVEVTVILCTLKNLVSVCCNEPLCCYD